MDQPLQLPILNLDDKKKETKILDILSKVIIADEKQEKIGQIFLSEISLGLMSNPEKSSSLSMINTFVEELINGTEEGEYLALDLGSTNFRVIFIRLNGGKITHEIVDYYDVPEDKKHGHGKYLFEFLASCIADFVRKNNLVEKHLNLGFTFSMPMVQTSINKSALKTWTKCFSCPGVVGEDVVAMLQKAINEKENLNVTVTAIMNDATGTLVQGSYLDDRCAIGLILGTGSNGCYIEKASCIETWKGDHTNQEVIINMECGAFGDNGLLDFLKTSWDYAVDEKSLFRKSFTYEKYFSGRYLGDVVREALLTLASMGLFGKNSLGRLDTQGSIPASDVALIERDSFENKITLVEEILEKLKLEYDKDDVKIIKYVCGIFSYRGVLLVSIICGVLLKRMKRTHCTIAIDGSLYENHPRYKPLLNHLISIFAPGHSFSLLLAKDGSGKGAGLVAAVEDRRSKSRSY